MKDFNAFLQEKFADIDFIRKYYKMAVFSRLANQLLLLRKERGLTQSELAETAGTTQAVVSRLENASVKPSLESIVKIAEALGAVVEVRLIPIEEKLAKLAEPAQDEETPILNKEFELIKNIVFSEVEPTAKKEKPITWNQPNSWGLVQQPPLKPVLNKTKTRVPA